MLTQAQIDQFHRDGFLILRDVFDGRELEELIRAADRVREEGDARQGSHHLYRDQSDGSKTYFRSEKMWERDDIFRAATVKPELLECIGQCLGHPFLPINDSFVCKIPHGNVPIPWHQDPPYNDPAREETFPVPNFDIDIYLDRSTTENGCVWGIPGHHLVGHVDLSPHSEEELFENFGAVPMEMKPGDVLFHSISGPHGSIGNTTSDCRKIFYVHYMAREVVEECYAEWSFVDGRGFHDKGRAFVERMLEDRKRMGFGELEGSRVRWSERGFEFVGRPSTPPAHWGALIDKMPAGEKAKKKRLAMNATL